MAAPRHPVRVGQRFPVRVNIADPYNGAPDNIVLAWNLFQPDPIVGPEPVFSVASANYDESGNNIGNNPRIDAGKGLWMGPAVTNIDAAMSSYTKFNCTVSGIRITSTNNDFCRVVRLITVVAGQTYTISRRVAKRVGHILVSYYDVADRHNIISTMDGSVSRNDAGVVRVVDGGSYLDIHVTITVAVTSVKLMIGPASLGSNMSSIGDYVDVLLMWTSATAYPVPYVPPGATQPSNAATTGGNGVNIQLDAGLTAAYSGQNSFLDRVYFGFSSAQVSADTALRSVRNATTDVLYVSTGGVIKSSDGTNTATVTVTGGWSANQIISLYRRTTGTQMQVGYRKSVETAITWGSLVAYDGSDNPVTHELCCLNGTLPIWGQAKGTANKYCSDSELLEMEALAA